MAKNKSEIWLKDAILFTQDEKRSLLRACVQIIDGKIVALPKSMPSRISRSAKVINVKGQVLLPGFVQAHVHLCQTLFRNQADDLELLEWLTQRIWVMEAAHTPQTLTTSAELGISELLSSGTTCILDMGTVRHTESIFEAVKKSGIRASIGKCLMDHPSTTPENLREPTRDALDEAKMLYKKWHGQMNDRIRVSYAPRFVISCTEQLLSEIAKTSKEQGALVHTHASENLKEIQLVKQLVGCENVEYLHQLGLTSSRLVLAHCIWLKPNEKDILRKTGTHVVHCPSSNLKLASGLAHVPDLRSRGINVALGADGAPCNNNLNMFTEMRLAALIHKPSNGPTSMRAQEAIDMATRDGAKALNWFEQIGSIEIGKKADLISLDLNTQENLVDLSESKLTHATHDAIASAIVYSTDRSHLNWTMVDGKILFQKKAQNSLKNRNLIRRVLQAKKAIQAKMNH